MINSSAVFIHNNIYIFEKIISLHKQLHASDLRLLVGYVA